MEKEFVEKMKIRLEGMRREILELLQVENQDFVDLSSANNQKDFVDMASSDIDKRILSTLSAQEMKKLSLIDAALIRIQNGSYGICLKSGMEIPKERLEAIPYALYTVENQNQIEREKRF